MGNIIQFDKQRITKRKKEMKKQNEFNHLIQSLTAQPNETPKSYTPKQAAELLMPHDLFKTQYISACDDKKYNPFGSQAFVVKYLAKYFRVKQSSVIKRIGEVFFDGGF